MTATVANGTYNALVIRYFELFPQKKTSQINLNFTRVTVIIRVKSQNLRYFDA